MSEETKSSAVYVSFKTLNSALDSLAIGVPNQIDRSTFPGQSGGVQSQLLAGLKFLGLINDKSEPTTALHEVAVTDTVKRKEKLKEILHARYSDLFALDLTKTTPQQLSDCMGNSYSVNGDTKEKAIRFFLSAVAYVGIPVSRFLSKKLGQTNGKVRRRSSSRIKNQVDETQLDEDDLDDQTKPQGTSRAISLKSGGTLTISASVDLFQLTPEDRTFVFSLIDKLNEYEKTSA